MRNRLGLLLLVITCCRGLHGAHPADARTTGSIHGS